MTNRLPKLIVAIGNREYEVAVEINLGGMMEWR